MSEQEYLAGARKAHDTAGGPIELTLADGSRHRRRAASPSRSAGGCPDGHDQGRRPLPQPGNVLRPGQFARVRAQRSVKTGALLVPQRAVMEQQGSYQVAVVGADQKVDIRPVKVGQQVNGLWVVDDGVRPGERVIVEGLQKVRPGMVVAAAPYAPGAPALPTKEASPETLAAPAHQAKR